MRKLFALLAFLPFCSQAQELLSTVQVLSPNVQNTSKQIFITLETGLREFINTTQWTRENYDPEEKIECTFVLNIVEQVSVGNFKATLQVQYSRPVFNSSYRSPILNVIDKSVNFNYLESDRLEFIENTHVSNLTSIIAFYVYVMIGMDHDSFEKGSGESYYVKSQNIVNNAQNDPLGAGWKNSNGNTNRFWLADNLVSPVFKNLKDCYYSYHKEGLDNMYDPDKQLVAKENIANAIANLRVVHQKRPNSYLMNMFFDAKSREIVSLFEDGPEVDLSNVKTTLSLVDANNADLYRDLGNPK